MRSSPRLVHRLCFTAVAAAFGVTLPPTALADNAQSPPSDQQNQQNPQDQGGQPPPPPDQTALQNPAITSVLVTSRKFAERLIDVPIAISVFSNEDLLRRGADNIGQVLQSVPGVSVYDGGSGVSKISIRGISTSLGGNENGYYLDDLPFTGVTVPIAPDVRAWDLERVEVLRGPQGTLFGEGSMGGTIRTLTNNARLNTFSFAGQTGWSHTEGGGDNRSVKAMINVPVLTDMLAVRVAMTDEDNKGWIDDSVSGARNLNSSRPKSVRLRTLFKPTEQLTINATYWDYQNDLPSGSSETDGGKASRGTILRAAPSYTLKGVSGTYDFDSVSLFYGYAKNKYQLPQAGSLAGGVLNASIGIDVETQELRLSSNSQKPWRWTAGLYQRSAERFDIFSLEVLDIDQTSATNSRASAVFGEVTYTWPEFPLEASLGLRHFRDRMTGQDVNSEVALPATRNTFSSNNPRLSLAYRPNDQQQIYTSASKGFRSGQNQVTGVAALADQYGVVLPSSIKSDAIWTYEVGTKVSLLERRLNLELAAYRSDWKDFAVRIPIAATGFNGLISSPGTRTNGLDASVVYAVNRSFTASVAAGLVDATYKGDVAGTGIRSSGRVDDVPRYTFSASGEYSFAAFDGWGGRARAGVQRAGLHPVSPSPIQADGDAVTSVDARLSFSKGPWTLSIFGDNLGNNRGATGIRQVTQLSATESEQVAPRLRPRTAGLDLRYAFGK